MFGKWEREGNRNDLVLYMCVVDSFMCTMACARTDYYYFHEVRSAGKFSSNSWKKDIYRVFVKWYWTIWETLTRWFEMVHLR